MPNVPSPTFDQYELQTDFAGKVVVLSADGTGSTHRAKDTRTGQPVIVRIFSERLLADSSVQREFVSHAKLLIELDHPSVTRIVDTGQYANQFFYVLQDPGGETLEEWVETSGPIEVALALRLNLQLSEALLAVRSKPGLLSRVWPRSLMRTGEDDASKIHLVAQNLVAPGEEEEQPEFLAPEILAGHQDTAQASLYSIGATLYYMLTGQPPYPSGLPIEDLLELKSTRLPDMTALPEAAPVTLLRQVLDADPRNRPKSLMEWDRALQRFIRFTPTDTSAVTIQPESPSEEEPSAPEVPSPPVESKPITPFHGPPARTDNDPEFEKVKVHTQRLSVELTKRVQKELALTTQLKTLESELEKERSRVQELTARQPVIKKAEITKLQQERSKISKEWSALKDARKNLEKEQHEFLKKTQRFSVSKAKADTVAKSTDESLTATQRVTGKPRFFRFGRKDKKASTNEAPTPESTPKPEAKPTAKPAAKVAPAKVAPEEPKKQAPPQKKRVAAQTAPRKQKAEAAAKPVQAKAKPTPSKVVTFKQPNAAETPPLRSSRPEQSPAKTQAVRATATAKPANKGATARERLAAETTKPTPPKATPKPKTTKASKPLPAPQYQPLPGAWVALTILAAVIALGLFLAYRTFFGRQDHYLLGSLQNDAGTPTELTESKDPTIVNIGSTESPAPFDPLVVPQVDPEEGPDSLDEATITVTPSDPVEPSEISPVAAPAPSSREAIVNEELKVNMKTFNNFLLVQDEEWPELLHSLKGLKLPSNKYSEEEIHLICQELYDDLDRKAELRKDSKDSLLKNPQFKELFDYLKSLLPPNPGE